MAIEFSGEDAPLSQLVAFAAKRGVLLVHATDTQDVVRLQFAASPSGNWAAIAEICQEAQSGRLGKIKTGFKIRQMRARQ